MWLTYILIAAPLGVVFGYGMCALMIDSIYGWRLAFYIQAALLIVVFIGIIITPNQYIDVQDLLRRLKEMKNHQSHDLENEAKESKEDTILEGSDQEDENNVETERIHLRSSLKTVLTNKYYICMCAALTGVFYLCTGI